jgi:preprotein translocase subunit SecE
LRWCFDWWGDAVLSAPRTLQRVQLKKRFVKNIGLIIWIVLVGVVFGVLWYQGYLVKIRNYVAETSEELKKCTWPSWEELKGSTVLVMITMALLGLFTIAVDFILSVVNRGIH